MWRKEDRKYAQFLFITDGIHRPWVPAGRIPLHVPSRMSMLQTLARCECKIALGNDRQTGMRRLVLRSLAAQKLDSLCGSFEIWDLGSMVVDRPLGRPPPAPSFPSSTPRLHDCARLAQTLWIGHLRRGKGFGSNMTIAVLGGLGSDAPEPWTSCKQQLAAHERVSVREWIVLQIG